MCNHLGLRGFWWGYGGFRGITLCSGGLRGVPGDSGGFPGRSRGFQGDSGGFGVGSGSYRHPFNLGKTAFKLKRLSNSWFLLLEQRFLFGEIRHYYKETRFLKTVPIWPCSSVGRATVIYSGGHGIESHRGQRFFLFLRVGPFPF